MFCSMTLRNTGEGVRCFKYPIPFSFKFMILTFVEKILNFFGSKNDFFSIKNWDLSGKSEVKFSKIFEPPGGPGWPPVPLPLNLSLIARRMNNLLFWQFWSFDAFRVTCDKKNKVFDIINYFILKRKLICADFSEGNISLFYGAE